MPRAAQTAIVAVVVAIAALGHADDSELRHLATSIISVAKATETPLRTHGIYRIVPSERSGEVILPVVISPDGSWDLAGAVEPAATVSGSWTLISSVPGRNQIPEGGDYEWKEPSFTVGSNSFRPWLPFRSGGVVLLPRSVRWDAKPQDFVLVHDSLVSDMSDYVGSDSFALALEASDRLEVINAAASENSIGAYIAFRRLCELSVNDDVCRLFLLRGESILVALEGFYLIRIGRASILSSAALQLAENSHCEKEQRRADGLKLAYYTAFAAGTRPGESDYRAIETLMQLPDVEWSGLSAELARHLR